MSRGNCRELSVYSDTMLLALLMILPGYSCEKNFNITKFTVPVVVPPGQPYVDLECKYTGDFTLLSWFKGPQEFIRHKPGANPETRSFPIVGVGKIDILYCGPQQCKVRLNRLSKEASGLYRCDIERELPPYHFATRKANMTIESIKRKYPIIKGVHEKYGEGDILDAECVGTPGSTKYWYINGKILSESNGLSLARKRITRFDFIGDPLTMMVQCAEFINGTFHSTNDVIAHWRDHPRVEEASQCNAAYNFELNLFVLIAVCTAKFVSII